MGLTMSDKPRNFATRTIHAGEQFSVAENAIFPAIVTASSFTKRSLDDKPEYSYSRVGNPTRHAYETCVAALEEGVGAVACASGVNATATVLELLPKDAHVVVMNGVYGGTFRILEDYRSRTSGLTTTYVDLNDLEAVAAAIKPETQLIWIESPTNPLLHLVDMAPLDESSPADAAEVIVNELTRFSPSLAERERWLVLNKADMVMEDERDARVQEVVERLQWEGPVYVISAISKQGTEKLSHDLMRYLEDRADRLANDPAYAEELADLDQRIEDEARAQLQALDDARTLRRTGVKSVHDIGDDDGWDDDFEDDEGGPEIIYVRD